MTPRPQTSRPSSSRVAPLTVTQARHAFSWSRLLILLVLLLMQLLTMLGIFWAGRQNSERVLQVQARNALDQLVRVTADNTHSYLQAATNIVKLNREILGTQNVPLGEPPQLLGAMNAVVNSVSQIDGAMIGQSDGSFVFVRRDGQVGQERFTRVIQTQPARQVTDSALDASGKVTSQQTVNSPFDPRTRPWFQQAVSNPAAVVWTAPYVFASSRLPGITVSAALPTPAGKTAVVAMDVQLRGLTRFLEALQISPNGRAFIADNQGHAIAASRAWPSNVQGRIPLLSEVGDPALQALLGAGGTLPDSTSAQADHLRLYQVNGQPYAAIVRQIEVQPGTHWIVGVYAPEADFTSELRALYQRQLASILMFMLFSTLLAWPLAFRATQPLASLQRQATTDALTGLRNRASFLAHLHDELKQAPHAVGELGVVILDLDGFKAINDRFGHGLGDEVLHAIGARLLGAVRAGDILGRLGGDEFALVVKGRTQEVVKLRVEGLIEDVVRRPIQTDGMEHLLGATAGLAFYDRRQPQDAPELIAQADKALLRGKKQQKGRVWVSGELGSTLLD